MACVAADATGYARVELDNVLKEKLCHDDKAICNDVYPCGRMVVCLSGARLAFIIESFEKL